MYRSLQWALTIIVGSMVFAIAWWFFEQVFQMPRGDSIGIAAIPSALVTAPLAWWSGRERGKNTEDGGQTINVKRDGWPLVSESDPFALGVHRTRQHEDESALPSYVGRDIDNEVQDRIKEAAQNGGFVLLAGDSATGKTRTALHALKILLSDYRIVYPPRGVDFRQLMNETLGGAQKIVLWLDDLEGYIDPQGLQPDIVDELKRRLVPVVATIRHEQLDHFRKTYTGHGQETQSKTAQQEAYIGSRVINSASIIDIPRKWSFREIHRASSSPDSRIQEALEQSELYGVAEYIAAGPQLLDEWKRAFRASGNPRGASLVSAAVDFARSGLIEPIPSSLLEEVHGIYLSKEGGTLLHPEPLAEAFDWANAVRYGATSLLLPYPDSCWRPIDYLVDAASRDSLTPPPPDEVWHAAIEYVTSSRGYYTIGVSALYYGRIDITENAWSAAVDEGSSWAAFDLGTLLWKFRRFNEAQSWYIKSYELGFVQSALKLGDMFASIGSLDDADNWWHAAAECGVQEARDRKVIDAEYLDHDLTRAIANSQIEENLGEVGVADTLLNLWPTDCQTCGNPIGSYTPVLYFSYSVFRRAVTLHHAECRDPAWDSDNLHSSDALLSWKSFAFVSKIGPKETEARRIPVVLINPSLEFVWVHETDYGWRPCTVDQYRTYGFVCLKSGIPLPETPVSSSNYVPRVAMTAENIKISLGAEPDWDAPIDHEFFETARDLNGFSLWVTTRINPTDGRINAQHLMQVISDGAVAGRWVSLDSENNDLRNKVRSSRDYVLYWAAHESVVGEVITQTEHHRSPDAATNWAMRWLEGELDAKLEDGSWISLPSTGGQKILDPVSVAQYFLHPHRDRWILARGISHYSGVKFESQEDVEDWATNAVRFKLGEGEMKWRCTAQVSPGGVISFYSKGKRRR